MALVEDLKDARYGTVQAKAVYVGAEKVWPPAVWTPADIPGLTLWVDASQGSYTVGAKLFAIPDYSPAARTLTITGGNEPFFRTVRGRPAFSWESPAYGLYCGEWNPGTAGLTFFFVGEILSPSNYPMLVVYGPDADGFEMRHDGSSLQIVLRYGTHGVVYSHGTPNTANADSVMALRVRGTAGSDGYVNGVKTTGPGVTMPNVSQALFTGRRTGGYPFYGPMREVLAYAGPVSDADMNVLWLYLQAKWGL